MSAAERYEQDRELFGDPPVVLDNRQVPAGMTRGEALELAEEWVRRGVPVFPIAISWDPAKGGTHKRPLTEHGHLDATVAERAVRLAFNKVMLKAGEEFGVGLHLGPAGFLAVDLDGQAALAAWDRRDLPASYTSTTCSGGRHVIFAKPEQVPVGTRCDWGEVDVIRSDDGWIVAPGTFTPWGEWLSHDAWSVDVEDCPAELWDAIDHGAPGMSGPRTGGTDTRGVDAVVARLEADGRDQDAETLRMLVDHYGAHHPWITRSGELFVTRPDKSAGTSASIGYVGPGVVKMFSSRWEPFTKNCRYIISEDGTELTDENTPPPFRKAPPPGVNPTTGEILAKLDIPVSWSDAHVGEAFGATLTGRWLHCRALGGWQQWDGRRWRLDPGEAVFEEFRQWIIAIGEQLWHSDGDAETMKKVARYRDRGKIDAAVTIARRLEPIAARADEFDTHPHLLNVHNGVVNLRTGELGPHDPTLRIRQLAGADYRPDARHPDIDAVLDVMTSGVRNWVQRLLGSAAVGTVVDDIVAVADGKGSNGKTTLLKMAAVALGDYATPASTRLLITRATHDEHPTLIADLFGRRLVYIEETPEGGALKMEQLKALSGGTEIKARFIAKDQFTFTPTHQFIVATNHRPAVNASDHAAWRRLRLIPFPNTYRKPHEAQPGDLIADLGLRGRLTRQPQREAALAWIIDGAVTWHHHGLGGCNEIDAATDAWRRSEDVIEAWWNDRIIIDHTGDTGAADLYRSFTNWCDLNGRRPPSNKEFAKKLTDHELYERHLIDRHDGMTGRVYRGFTVRLEGR